VIGGQYFAGTGMNSFQIFCGSGGGGATPVNCTSGHFVLYGISESSSGGGGGSSFPFTIIQSDQETFTSGTSFTYTFPSALQSSGATAMVIFAADGSGTFTFPSGWTCSINVSSGTNFPRLGVCIVASAGQTSISFSGSTVVPSLRFYEFSGSRSFDVTSGTQFNSGSPTNVKMPSITPTSGAAVFDACTWVQGSTSIVSGFPSGRPDWTNADVWSTLGNGRVIAGAVLNSASTGAAVQPPQITLASGTLSSSGVACATWSIK
jgi:hypothetical protein